MKRLLLPCALLVALLFPGFSRAEYVNHHGIAGPRAPTEEARGRGTNASQVFRHQAKRSYLARTPPYPGDIPPGIRNTICLLRHGTCRLFFCRSGEKKGDICSDPWNRCCVSPEAEA
ncbi:sperm-associated antigen 11B-like [Artibeus jamaicensis]|uniref:sperm-associated antigen 11B-like n=1 Tax=Artibeus jamaicensis TaxID=9417 RepID=UPI00235AB672|nr:sperm-associated antigen 11B-like [Artibeus jamaicensis]